MIVLFIITIIRVNLQVYLQNLLVHNVKCQGKYKPPRFLFIQTIAKNSLCPRYCKFGNFRENFIFANSVKRHNCDGKIRDYDKIYLH